MADTQILSFHKNIAACFTVLFAMYCTSARCSYSPFKYNHTGAISALYAIKATCTRLAQIIHNTFFEPYIQANHTLSFRSHMQVSFY